MSREKENDSQPEVRDVESLQSESPVNQRVEPADSRALTGRETVERAAANERHERSGVLPQTRVGEAAAADTLVNPKASAQDKLAAVEALAKAGKDRVTITDADGTTRECRVELEKSGSKTLVHLHGIGSDGKEHVMLRGVSNGDGTYSHEKDSKGRDVDFAGTWWSKNMAGKSSIAVTDSSAPERPSVPGQNAEMPDRLPGPRRQYEPQNQSYELPPGVSRQSEQYEYAPTNYDHAELNSQFDRLAGMASGRRHRMERLPDGTVYINAGMKIDADGAPDARRIDPVGQTRTSLQHPDGRYVNAREHPYFVLPVGEYQKYGIRTGDIAAVRYNGKVEFAVFADAGPAVGEGSMALAQKLGINNNPRTGGVDQGVEYLVFPRSGNRTPGTPEENRQVGMQQLRRRADRFV